MNKLYVKRNVRSLRKIGTAIAGKLKMGRPVGVKYSEDERAIVVRFHEKAKKLYDGHDVDYPSSGWVVYASDGIHTYSKSPTENVDFEVELVYDAWGFKAMCATISYWWYEFVGHPVEEFKNLERW